MSRPKAALDQATLDRPGSAQDVSVPELPGAIVLFSDSTPLLHALPLDGGALRLGRGDGPAGPLPDATLSRQHVELRLDGDSWCIRDLGSRNGTFVDGARVSTSKSAAPRCVRISNTIVRPVRDVRPFLATSVRSDGERVVGPRLEAVLARVRLAAQARDTLLITGESGTGKELAAREYHASGPHAGGPFVAVNCAAIPEAIAERLLFGARKGAYSGASADAEGHVQAAAGGVLFLDEIGELDAGVQAKLLRLLESHEVMPLGAARPQRVDVAVCCATHRGLRQNAAEGRFRQDLLFRVSQSTVEMPPLRDRPEEIAWLACACLARLPNHPAADARFIEQCLLRDWPGNVRELQNAVRTAARDSKPGKPLRLSDEAGRSLAEEPDSTPAVQLTREAIERALAEQRGNVAATARVLGVHRTAFYRLLKQLGIRE
jgi:DNA-binding NtrC family response regulator